MYGLYKVTVSNCNVELLWKQFNSRKALTLFNLNYASKTFWQHLITLCLEQPMKVFKISLECRKNISSGDLIKLARMHYHRRFTYFFISRECWLFFLNFFSKKEKLFFFFDSLSFTFFKSLGGRKKFPLRDYHLSC